MSKEYYQEVGIVEDFNWYRDNYESILEQYGKCHIVIRDKKVLGVYDSYKAALADGFVAGTFSYYDTAEDPRIPIQITRLLRGW